MENAPVEQNDPFADAHTFHFREVVSVVLLDIATVLLAVALIGAAARGIPGAFGRLLSLKPMVFVGTISYGIYVWHNFMPWFVAKIPPLHHALKSLHGGKALTLCGLSILLAYTSWMLFERPIVNLKRYFPYTSASPKRVDPLPVPEAEVVTST